MDKKERLKTAYDYLRFRGVIKNQGDVAEAMGTTRPNVSSALKGVPSVMTDSFVSRFCDCYDSYVNRRWILFGEGSMEKEPEKKPTSTDEQIANIIMLYANIIKDVEQLHKELLNEIEQTRSTRAELAQACTDLHTIIDDLRDDFQPSKNHPLIAAEKPNVYPSTKKKHS